MKILLIRHGETDWNARGIVQGREDIPLNESGRRQAGFTAATLADGAWRAVVTSPLSRARETAEIIARTLGVAEVREYDGLTERDYGAVSGMTKEERERLFPDGVWPGVERDGPLRSRVLGALLNAAKRYDPGDIIAVSHGSAINAVLAELTCDAMGTGKTSLPNMCVVYLSYDRREGVSFHGIRGECKD